MKKWILISLLLTGCQTARISVINKWCDSADLPSVFVKSPDPFKEECEEGEELIIRWNVPKRGVGATLTLKALLKGGGERVFYHSIKTRRGTWIVPFMGEEFKKTKGVIASMATIVSKEGETLASYRHPLFVEWIDETSF